MQIVVNVVALKSAGGRSVAFNFLRAFQENPRDHRVDVFAPSASGYEELAASPAVRLHIIPSHFHKRWFRPFLDRYWLRQQMEEVSPDIIFSMGNFALPTARKQVVLFIWPYATYPDSPVWKKMSWRDILVRRAKISVFRKRLRYATVVTPQTRTSADRLRKYFPEIPRLEIIPTAVTPSNYQKPLGETIRCQIGAADGRKQLLCLTRYYPHKNLEILLEVARIIVNKNRPYRIVLTISPDQHPNVRTLLAEVKRQGLEEVLLNIGPVPMDEVPALYRITDGLLLPTLLESFSGTYIDAMHYGKPVFTSNQDFARDVCADTAFYFDPSNASHILEVVDKAFADDDTLRRKTSEARDRAMKFPDWNEVAGRYLDLLECIVREND